VRAVVGRAPGSLAHVAERAAAASRMAPPSGRAEGGRRMGVTVLVVEDDVDIVTPVHTWSNEDAQPNGQSQHVR